MDNIFTIAPGIAKVIEAFNRGEPDSLTPQLGEDAVESLKKLWSSYEFTVVKITGDIWSHHGEQAVLDKAARTNIDSGKKVLDLGCGIGGPARILARYYGCKVVGIDINKDAVIIANALTRMEDMQNLVSFEVGDRNKLPYKDCSFDIVWEHAGFSTNEERLNTWCESMRVIKKGGQITGHADPSFFESIEELGFSEIRYYPLPKEEKGKNMKLFLKALEKNKKEIISRSCLENYEIWHKQKVDALEKMSSPSYKAGTFVAVK